MADNVVGCAVDWHTLLKPGTLLKIARSPKRRLFGLNVAVFCSWCWCLACNLRVMTAPTGVGAPPLLEWEADELPDVVDSVSTLLVATIGLAMPFESNWERKPRLDGVKHGNKWGSDGQCR